MKNLKKILAIVLVAMMVLSLSVTAFASDDPPAADDPIVGNYGSITVKNATKGQDYKAYKVFDATYNGNAVSYKTLAANASLLDDTLFGWSTVADTEGNISVWVKDGVAEADVIDWVKANYDKFGGTAIDGVFDDENSTVTFQALDYGYYYITSTLGSAVTIDSAVPTAEVYDKNETEPVAPVKTIVAVDGAAASDPKEADAHVGSIVDFKVTAKTNNWIDQDNIREEWELIDTPTNMELDVDSVVVKFNGSALTVGTDYTADIDPDTGVLTINVPMIDNKGNSIYPATQDNNGLIPIEITYSATITKDAGTSPAKNEIPGDEVDVYTYMFQLDKVDGDKKALLGAEFEIYNGETKLTFDFDATTNTYTYNPTGTVTRVALTETATAVITGLDNRWTLTVKEVVVPEGHNQAEDTSVPGSSLTKVEPGASPSSSLVQVVNQQGKELPSTGGIGTTLFYVIGSILVLGAGVVLVAKKRAID